MNIKVDWKQKKAVDMLPPINEKQQDNKEQFIKALASCIKQSVPK